MRRLSVVAVLFLLVGAGTAKCEQEGSRIAVKPGAGCVQPRMKGQDPDTGIKYICGGPKRPYHWIVEK